MISVNRGMVTISVTISAMIKVEVILKVYWHMTSIEWTFVVDKVVLHVQKCPQCLLLPKMQSIGQ